MRLRKIGGGTALISSERRQGTNTCLHSFNGRRSEA